MNYESSSGHAYFLWWNMGDERLSPRARGIISDGQNQLFLSAASAWEIAIKTSEGRLILPDNPEKNVAERLSLHRIFPLPIHLSHALHAFNLPEYHLDPFDRMLVAQSQLENLPILTADLNIASYEVEVIW
jgi:PIN domain nuclease of toxin-antitoxin system